MHSLVYITEAVMETSYTWLLWVALGFFFLMVFIGWLVSRKENQSR